MLVFRLVYLSNFNWELPLEVFWELRAWLDFVLCHAQSLQGSHCLVVPRMDAVRHQRAPHARRRNPKNPQAWRCFTWGWRFWMVLPCIIMQFIYVFSYLWGADPETPVFFGVFVIVSPRKDSQDEICHMFRRLMSKFLVATETPKRGACWVRDFFHPTWPEIIWHLFFLEMESCILFVEDDIESRFGWY